MIDLKKTLFIVVFIMISLFAKSFGNDFTDSNNFFLNGSVEKCTIITLRYLNFENKTVVDTCSAIQGTFFFAGKINGTSKSILSIYNKGEQSSIGEFEFFLSEATINVVAKNPYHSIYISGSETNDESDELNKLLKVNDEKILLVDKEIKQITDSHTENPKLKILVNLLDSLQHQKTLLRKKFANEHPHSFLSPDIISLLFNRREIDYEESNTLFLGLSERVRHSLYGVTLSEQLKIFESAMVGKSAPLFSKIDVNGKEVTLSEFKDKSYVLLNYWASYCAPCKEHIPHLKNLYKRYKKKGLEIIAISWDFDAKKCQQSIQRDSTYFWINIHGLSNKNDKDPFLTSYSIPFIPVYILIDRNGIIAGRYEDGNLERLESTLKRFLDK